MSEDKIRRDIESISSLEELHHAVHIVTFKGWIVLLFAFLFAIGVTIWGFFGKIPITVEGKCIVLEKSNDSLQFFGFLPLFSGEQVALGMEAMISLNALDASQYGMIRSKLIKKGMIYSPAYGDMAFTVPLFDEFMMRAIPEL